MQFKVIHLLFLTIVILTACSSSSKTSLTVNYLLDIKINSIYLWIDKMPRTVSTDNLNLSSDIIINSSINYDYKTIKLYKIIIIQEDNIIYSFKPITKDNLAFKSKNKRNILVSTFEDTLLPNDFDYNKLVDVKFIFIDNNKFYEKLVKNIKIDKVY